MDRPDETREEDTVPQQAEQNQPPQNQPPQNQPHLSQQQTVTNQLFRQGVVALASVLVGVIVNVSTGGAAVPIVVLLVVAAVLVSFLAGEGVRGWMGRLWFSVTLGAVVALVAAAALLAFHPWDRDTFSDDFHSADGWHTATASAAGGQYTGGAYVLPASVSALNVVMAPADAGSAIRITVTARLLTGQGGLGSLVPRRRRRPSLRARGHAL